MGSSRDLGGGDEPSPTRLAVPVRPSPSHIRLGLPHPRRTFFDWYGGLARAARGGEPVSVIPCCRRVRPVRASLEAMLIEDAEAPWGPIAERGDGSALHVKLAAIAGMAEAYGTQASPSADVSA